MLDLADEGLRHLRYSISLCHIKDSFPHLEVLGTEQQLQISYRKLTLPSLHLDNIWDK